MRNRILTAVLAAAVFISTQVAEAASPPAGFARAWLIEVDGVRRAAHNAKRPLPPASLTKMMSGLLILEASSSRRLDVPHRVSRHAAAATGSLIGLREGDLFRVEDLLTAMLIASANDACRALAEWHSGSEATFVERMNVRARQLRLRQTHFKNACGYDAAGHLSSADDLAALARHVMALPEYARRAALPRASIRSVGGKLGGREIEFSNRNQLIGRLDGAIGVKSGFTARAGKCVVAMAERNGHRVLLVMLDAPNRWWDAHAALDYALDHAPGLAR